MKITYADKRNAVPVVNEQKQVTAENLNMIKNVVNKWIDDVTEIKRMIGAGEISVEELKEVVDYIRTNRSDLANLSVDNIAGLQDILDELIDKSKGITANGVTFLTPLDGMKYFSSGTGAIKITLPNSWTTTMMMLHIDVFNYLDNSSFSLIISGCPHINKYWIRTSVKIIGDNNYNVRFGFDGTKACIYIAELNTQWSYMSCCIHSCNFHYTKYSKRQWLTGWDISLENNQFENVNKTHTNNLPVSR